MSAIFVKDGTFFIPFFRNHLYTISTTVDKHEELKAGVRFPNKHVHAHIHAHIHTLAISVFYILE